MTAFEEADAVNVILTPDVVKTLQKDLNLKFKNQTYYKL